MSNISKRRREGSRTKIKSMGDHREFLKRITKTLYYGTLPSLPCLSLPVTEISCEVWSMAQRGRSLRRLHADAAAGIARNACVSPCALVLALLYLERLNACNPDYLARAPPAELFLVSLMVGNKFLQDDGEDDDVICSEWATSGGIELNHLKKLELEFLSAIDWNVFVNDISFEMGLTWLERQVALKQARLRGFFTYTDLVATCDGALLTDLLKSVSTAWATVALGYMASIITVLTSTLVISQAWLPTLQYIAARTSPAAIDTNIITHNMTTELTTHSVTPYHTVDTFDQTVTVDKVKCCATWMKYQNESDTEKRNWFDSVVTYDWKPFEPWWSKTSVLNWLYQSSLVNPMQRWLERMNEYADLFRSEVNKSKHSDRCSGGHQHCLQQWLNLSKLSALMVTVSDR